jgi:asparagine synthase (glutamine-hydrolysing)
MKIRGFTKKHLLRAVARRELPASVFRHPKQGFASPMAAWLNRGLQAQLGEELAPERLARDGVFAPEAVAGLIREHATRRRLRDKTLFALLAFQRWRERSGTRGPA